MPTRIAVLASGSGSNLQAILDHGDALGTSAAGEVVLVASDRESSGALARARARSVAAHHLTKPERDDGMLALLRAHGVEVVVLAGYLRFVPVDVTLAYRGAIVNIHPALLPAFGGPGMYGDRVHEAVIRSGARVSGATVHFVDEVYDHGAIIAQWPVPVFASDTIDSLAHRVLEVEHWLYPRVVQSLCAGHVRLNTNGRVELDGAAASLTHFVLVDDPLPGIVATLAQS